MTLTHRIRRIIAVSVLGATLLLSGVATSPAEAAIRRPERTLARLVNEYRVAQGVDRLRLTAKLSRVAERNGARMARTGQITHTSDIPCAGANGEVAGIGTSVRDALRRLKNSPPHRQIILRPYWEKMGTGVRRGDNGLFYVTVVFCS